MKISEERKQTIKQYILEKIQQKNPSVSKTVSENLEINQATVHTYINELLAEGIIEKVKRGQYELKKITASHMLSRSRGELDSDTYALDKFVGKYIDGKPGNIRQIWNYAVGEMMNNVMDHSQAEDCELIIKQDYLTTAVWIFDDGIGIFEKIRQFFDYPSVDDAISELFKGKLTTDSRNHSGEGIFFTSKMMDRFFIISSGRIFTTSRFEDPQIKLLAAENQDGTCVMMELSNFSHKTAREFFDAYADAEGGFTKTKLPLKNMFDSEPVSRSQAKRLCNRLEKFEEITIDFEGISWMGQGFAHQLFVVFGNEHPEVKITAVNMNPDVKRMQYHVLSGETSL